MLDFSDVEHYALRVLVNPETKELTETALEYQQQYREVMIDEYQDSKLCTGDASDGSFRCEKRQGKSVYGGRCQAEHLPVPSGKTGAVYGKIPAVFPGGEQSAAH